MLRRWGRAEGWPAALAAGLVAVGGACHPFDCEDYFLCPATCAGECLTRLEDSRYSEPVLLWTGDPDAVPHCPGPGFRQARDGWIGRSAEDPSAVAECPPCACGRPSCELPEHVLLNVDPLCSGEPVVISTLPDWDGSCVAAPETLFDVRSFAAQTSVVCSPQTPPPAPPALSANIYGRVCSAWREAGLCGDPSEFCVPPEAPPDGPFRRCVRWTGSGESECSSGVYPDKVVLLAEPPGTPTCPACVCEAVGASCIALVELFDDPVCGGPDLTNGPISEAPSCVVFRGSGAVTSVAASWFVNDPGVGCVPQEGRGPSGASLPVERDVYCCEEREGQ